MCAYAELMRHGSARRLVFASTTGKLAFAVFPPGHRPARARPVGLMPGRGGCGGGLEYGRHRDGTAPGQAGGPSWATAADGGHGPAHRSRHGVLGSPALRLSLLTNVRAGVCLGALTVGLPARADESGSAAGAGWMLACLGLGSALAGARVGTRHRTAPPATGCLAALTWLAMLLALLAAVLAPLLMAILLTLAGAAFAPMTGLPV
ncbi:hypothetical protein ACFRNT_24395 [Streptomyces sp. NPDC056697]|uniref:hypothetical protein n=1 Tax=Streptomyces sp. NPDC056697 TaxID=3345915 RepID=UPI0036BA2179